MRILVKVGGVQLEEPSARADLARSVARAREAGHVIVLVHGGGNQIRSLGRRLGLEERIHEGLRITDRDTAEVVLMVLAGLVNKELAAAFEAQGVRAAGLCGADGSTFSAVKVRDRGVDLGYVGKVGRVDTRLLEALLAEGFVPLVATAAPLAAGESDARDRFYNVNADLAAGPLARALAAGALLFLTDVPGVLDARGQPIAELSPERCAELRAAGVLRGGMIPKVEAALAALAENPVAVVKIAPAAGPDSVLAALDPATGTRFTSHPHHPATREAAWTSTS